MSISTIVFLSILGAAILIFLGGLLVYMANLVKNAYEIKVQLSSDLEAQMLKISEELDKKSRWIKRDLIEEIEKIKIAIEVENAKRIQAMSSPFDERLDGMSVSIQAVREECAGAAASNRRGLARLDERITALREEVAPAPAAAASDDGTAAGMVCFLPDLERSR